MVSARAFVVAWFCVTFTFTSSHGFKVVKKLKDGSFKVKSCVKAPWDTDNWSLQLTFKEPVDSVQSLTSPDDVTITPGEDRRIQHLTRSSGSLTKKARHCEMLKVVTSSGLEPSGTESLLQPDLETSGFWFAPGSGGGLNGKFCLVPSTDMASWNLRMEVNMPTQRLEIWDAEVKQKLNGGRVYLLSNLDKNYHYRTLTAGQKLCMNFNVRVKKNKVPSIRVNFDPPQEPWTSTESPTSTSPPSVSTEAVTTTHAPTSTPLPSPFRLFLQWTEGYTGRLCLEAPVRMCKWRILVEVDPPVRELSVWNARVTAASNGNRTFTVDYPTYDLDLEGGEVFCSDVMAYVTSPFPPIPEPPSFAATFDPSSGTCDGDGSGPVSVPTTVQPVTPESTSGQPSTEAATTSPPSSSGPSTTPQSATSQPSTDQVTTPQVTTPQVPTGAGGQHQGIMGLYSQTFSGEGTYYGYSETGLCSYSPPDLPPAAKSPVISKLVALNQPQLFGSLACGTCFKVRGSGQGLGHSPITGDFYVFVKDVCPECKEGDLDLSESGDGRWDIEIQAVQCPVGNSKLEYLFQGSNAYYLKLQIRNGRIPTTKVEMKMDGQYRSLELAPDNFWLLKDVGPIDTANMEVRLTAANGQQVEDVIPHLANDEVIAGQRQVQYPLDPSLPMIVVDTPQLELGESSSLMDLMKRATANATAPV